MSKLKLMFIFLSVCSFALSQNMSVSNIEGNNGKIGFKFGGQDTYGEPRIGFQTIWAITFEKKVSEKITLMIDGEYYEKSFNYSEARIASASFGDRLMNKWHNFSMNLGLATQVTDKGRISFGISGEYFVIYSDIYTNSYLSSTWKRETQNLIRPGFFGCAGLDFRLNNYFTFFVDGMYKAVLMGKKYGVSDANLLFSLSAYAGFKLDV